MYPKNPVIKLVTAAKVGDVGQFLERLIAANQILTIAMLFNDILHESIVFVTETELLFAARKSLVL
jgi:hypothetical protein